MIAYRDASVPEVIDQGVTGAIVENIAEAAAAVERVADFDRRSIREMAERRFSAERMAHDYLLLYERIAKEATQGDLEAVGSDRTLFKDAS